jgi:predicted metalloprotease with PDZ domain
MSKSIAVATGLFILAAAAATLAARPAPAPPTPPADPAPPSPARAPRAPHDRTLFYSSGGSWLGVSIADVTAERVKELGLKEETGAEIKGVLPGSPAEEAGLEKEDVILEYQGDKVAGAAQLTRLVRETPAGRTVTLGVSRGGSMRSVKVKVTEDHGGFEHKKFFTNRIVVPSVDIPPIEIPEIDIPEIPLLEGMPSTFRLGVSVEDLTGQLGEYFGVKDGDGVLVRSVKKGSPADAGGLRAGDVIVKVDGEKVADSSDLRSAMRERRGKTFPLGVVRDRRETSLTVTLPKRDVRAEDSEDEEEESSRDHWFEKRIEEGVRQKLEGARSRMEAARAQVEAARLLAVDSI